MAVPNRLRIVDGILVMDDGSSVQDYLKAWQIKVAIPNNSAVVLWERGQAAEMDSLVDFMFGG